MRRLALAPLFALLTAHAAPYVVVVSDHTYADPAWRPVAEALGAKYAAPILTHPAGDPEAIRAKLAAAAPDLVAFVARPEECGRAYVAAAFHLVRKLDDDPYEDAVWGVITGRDGAAALAQVKAPAPGPRGLELRTGLGTTGIADARFASLLVFSDGERTRWHKKHAGGPVETGLGLPKPDAVAWADYFSTAKPDFIATSSHGFQDGVEMPFSRGMIRTHAGTLRIIADFSTYGTGTDARKKARHADAAPLPLIPPDATPRAWLASGNCLIGHCRDRDSLVPVMMSAYGARQMAGYTVVTWYGAAGWGAHTLFLDGRQDISLADSIWFSRQKIIGDLATAAPAARAFRPRFDESDATGGSGAAIDAFFKSVADAGLAPRDAVLADEPDARSRALLGDLWDRDTFVMYGDPALRVGFPESALPHAATLTWEPAGEGRHRLTATWPAGASLGKLPPLAFRFPKKFAGTPHLAPSAPADTILADDFLLVRAPRPDPATRRLTVEILAPVARPGK